MPPSKMDNVMHSKNHISFLKNSFTRCWMQELMFEGPLSSTRWDNLGEIFMKKLWPLQKQPWQEPLLPTGIGLSRLFFSIFSLFSHLLHLFKITVLMFIIFIDKTVKLCSVRDRKNRKYPEFC